MIRLFRKEKGSTFILGLLSGYRGWALLGLIVASAVGYLTIKGSAGGLDYPAPPTYIASRNTPGLALTALPAFAPKVAPVLPPEDVVPDTVNGELVWPDPWDQITEPAYRGY